MVLSRRAPVLLSTRSLPNNKMEANAKTKIITDAKTNHPFYRASKEERLKMLAEFWEKTKEFEINESDMRTLRKLRGKDSE